MHADLIAFCKTGALALGYIGLCAVVGKKRWLPRKLSRKLMHIGECWRQAGRSQFLLLRAACEVCASCLQAAARMPRGALKGHSLAGDGSSMQDEACRWASRAPSQVYSCSFPPPDINSGAPAEPQPSPGPNPCPKQASAPSTCSAGRSTAAPRSPNMSAPRCRSWHQPTLLWWARACSETPPLWPAPQ